MVVPAGYSDECGVWTTEATVLAMPGCSGLPHPLVDSMALLASRVMAELCGHRWQGKCSDTIRPESLCGLGFGDVDLLVGGLGSRGLAPDGHFDVPLTGGGGCGGHRVLRLPGQPVRSVEQVVLYGVVLDPSLYRAVDDGVVRVNRNIWPCAWDVTKEPPDLEVTYSYGAPIPPDGIHAATVLAIEFVRARTSDADSGLNRRVRQIIRQGTVVDVALPGLVDALKDARFGIPEVDAFVAGANPGRLAEAPRVLSPDMQVNRRPL